MERKILLLSAAVLFSTAGLLPAQQRIEHKRPNFAITIPAEFKPAQREGANLLVFTAPREDGALAISLADLGGTIGLEPLKASDLPPPTASSPQIRLEYLPCAISK